MLRKLLKLPWAAHEQYVVKCLLKVGKLVLEKNEARPSGAGVTYGNLCVCVCVPVCSCVFMCVGGFGRS